MPTCATFSCTNRQTPDRPDVKFFPFPKNEELKAKWVAAIRREDLKVTKSTRICSAHFYDQDIEPDRRHLLRPDLYSRNVPTLKAGAIPISPLTSQESITRANLRAERLHRRVTKQEIAKLLEKTMTEVEEEMEPEQTTFQEAEQPEHVASQPVNSGQVPTEPMEKTQPQSQGCCQCACSSKRPSREAEIQVDVVELFSYAYQASTPLHDSRFDSSIGTPKIPRNSTNQAACPTRINFSSPNLSQCPVLPLNFCSPVPTNITETTEWTPSSSSPLGYDHDESWRMESEEESSGSEGDESGQSANRERKFIIFESKLDELLCTCIKCGGPIAETKESVHGGNIKVVSICTNSCTYTWNGQPQLRSMAAGNLATAAAILFSGITYSKFQQFASLLNLECLAEGTFYDIQKDLLWPVVKEAWEQERESVQHQLEGKEVKLAGDGRCDSPGHTAKYGTYTLMDCESGKVVDFEVVQKSEVKNSSVMEKEGLVRCLDRLEENSVNVVQLATDRHLQISSYMDKQHPDICHQYDLWHVAKGVSKKLGQKAKAMAAEDLSGWIRSVVNHLWWCCASCDGDVDLLHDMWRSTIHHTANIHTWGFSNKFSECAHDPLSEEDADEILWLTEGSEAHAALCDIVTNKKLMKDLARMTQFCHTGSLEVYHAMLTKYCPKKQHFLYEGMVARTMLAALDHNHNTGRGLATTQEGELRYKHEWSKISRCWVAKPIYTGKNYSYLDTLMDRVVQVREENMHLSPISRPLAAKGNIAPEARPNIQLLQERHQSRFR